MQRRQSRVGALLRVLTAAVVCSCAPQSTPPPPPVSPAPPAQATHQAVAPGEVITGVQPRVPRIAARSEDHVVGVALSSGVQRGNLSATGQWRLYTNDDRVVVNGTGRGVWLVEGRDGGTRLRISTSGQIAATRPGPLIARPDGHDAFVTWNGVSYRGSLEIWPTTTGLLVVNRLPVEEYLRGVVALELGAVGDAERSAMEAQAVAARSYVYVRLNDPDRPAGGTRFDLLATVTDQVYGGVPAETPVGDEAVAATAGQVIMYAGRVVNAPYFATCGGSTAEPSEVWRESPLPYLTRVSDRIPGTDRYYCEGSSHFRWERSFTGSELSAVINTYMRQYATPTMSLAGNAPVGIPGTGSLGNVRGVRVEALTPSGRVGSLVITTSKGTYHLRGNDIRFVLRLPHGAILNSTYFQIEDERVRDGTVTSLTLRGRGNGHGVGMCQWGAIGRARAGQDYRTILRTYYPGTVLASVD